MTFGKAINKSWGHLERQKEWERGKRGVELCAYLNIQSVALIYEMWQKQKQQTSVWKAFTISIYIYRIVLAPILRKCDRNNVRKNAKTIMRNIFSLWALKLNSSTSRRQTDRIIPTPSTCPSFSTTSPYGTQSIAKQNGPTICSVFTLGKLIA